MKFHFSIYIVLFFFSPLLLLGQSKATFLHRELKWSEQPHKYTNSNGQVTQYYYFDGSYNSYLSNYLPLYGEQISLKSGMQANVALKNETYQVLPYTIPVNQSKLTAQAQLTSALADVAKKQVLQIELLPMRINSQTQQLEVLTAFDLEVTYLPKPIPSVLKNTKSVAAHSVLATGNWVKVTTTETGIYKLDKAYLSSIGLNVSAIDPTNIRIYGNGGGMIPQYNGSFRYDDLHENPIYVYGESDHQINDGDYILFYGQGADLVYYDSLKNRMVHEKNLYSNVNYYFITADLGPGKRITSLPNLATFNQTSTSADGFVYRDNDEVNITLSGRQWFEKDDFANIKNKTYDFNVPNRLAAEPVLLTMATAGKHTSNSNITVTLNGQYAQTHSFTAVYDGYENDYADATWRSTSLVVGGTNLQLAVSYDATGGNAWFDYAELQFRQALSLTTNQLSFRDSRMVGAGKVTQYQLQQATNCTVWDVTNPAEPINQLGQFNGSTFSFNATSDSLHEYIAFNGATFLTPVASQTISNQDLHALLPLYPQLIIVTAAEFMSQALELKAFHEALGQTTIVVEQSKIYNEFSSGKNDISGIRDFVKFFYDGAGNDLSKTPKYLLLIGDGSYDNRNIVPNNSAFLPTYQSAATVETIYSYGSDDFYGLLSPTEGLEIETGYQLLDIAIGRLPVKSAEEAQDIVAKIKHYKADSYGSWRNMITFVADDENQNLHLNQSDAYAEQIRATQPTYNIDKIYLDAYKQEESSAGARYPDVHDAIIRRIESGTVIMNYTGHGGESGWCHERVFQSDDIRDLSNFDKLTVFITATCQFSRYDRSDMVTAGEELILNKKGGAIALLTTTRLVYSSDNQAMNNAVYKNYFNRNAEGRHYTFGEVTQLAKNDGSVGKSENNRKFTLLGDPALPLPFADYRIENTFINGKNLSVTHDTIKALTRITVKGVVTDTNGVKLSNYNGIVFPTLFDKPVQVATLANDPAPAFPDGSYVRNFTLQKNAIYRGKASVVNGDFAYTFIVPKDIAYYYGKGKFSYYADNAQTDASGFDDQQYVGGISTAPITDKKGPVITLYMNDSKFVSGGMTDANPILLVNLFDESGINTLGTGVGHDILAVLDEDTKNAQTLNDFYESELDNFQKGKISFPFSKLAVGKHTLKVKAWDVYNNSAEAVINFEVVDQQQIKLANVYNYPNPFVNQTQFMFDHNQLDISMQIMIKIYTVSGKVVKTIQQQTTTSSYHTDGIMWDGTDDFGDKLARGVYFYRVQLRDTNGKTSTQMQKLVIL